MAAGKLRPWRRTRFFCTCHRGPACGMTRDMSPIEEEIASALPTDLDALPRLNGFRLRGLEMTRLEGFVDATFAFTITVLIIAGQQVPRDVETLLAAFRDVPAFAASIAVLA